MPDYCESCGVSNSTVSRVINHAAQDIKHLPFSTLPKHILMDEFKSVKQVDSAMSFIFCDATSHKIIDGGVIGNIITGKVKEKYLTKSLLLVLFLLIIVLLMFVSALKFTVTAFLICLLFGIGTFGTLPLLNSKIILTAKEAPLLSGTVAAAVFNLANFLGAILSTILLSFNSSYPYITIISVIIILMGVLLTIIIIKYENKYYFQ
ncbi:hypothetical protein BUZ01_07190 [Staphylococcus gallinarum]|uniref:Uncharacterized protein n=1 Tax=Staphylococcus gallinarum TaxID=1293 RepID=A0A418HNH5_STAGA|nr:hypothetical protein BUZ01_07190 [Staphylococcus gallinarum]RIO91978.1 hypothetical protein BUZ04_08260 [Staphylococcus gallinarum]